MITRTMLLQLGFLYEILSDDIHIFLGDEELIALDFTIEINSFEYDLPFSQLEHSEILALDLSKVKSSLYLKTKENKVRNSIPSSEDLNNLVENADSKLLKHNYCEDKGEEQ